MIKTGSVGGDIILVALWNDGMPEQIFEVIESSEDNGFLIKSKGGNIVVEPMQLNKIKISIK